MTAKALATLIEDEIATNIASFAGAGGTSPDPDLPAEQRLKEVTGGYLIFDQDYEKGPLVRLAVTEILKVQDQVGYGPDNRSAIFGYGFTLVGLTAPYARRKDAADASKLMEHIIRLRLLKSDVDGIVTEATYQKLEEAALLINVKNGFDLVGVRQNDLRYVGLFWQEWGITGEALSG